MTKEKLLARLLQETDELIAILFASAETASNNMER